MPAMMTIDELNFANAMDRAHGEARTAGLHDLPEREADVRQCRIAVANLEREAIQARQTRQGDLAAIEESLKVARWNLSIANARCPNREDLISREIQHGPPELLERMKVLEDAAKRVSDGVIFSFQFKVDQYRSDLAFAKERPDFYDVRDFERALRIAEATMSELRGFVSGLDRERDSIRRQIRQQIIDRYITKEPIGGAV